MVTGKKPSAPLDALCLVVVVNDVGTQLEAAVFSAGNHQSLLIADR